MSENGELSVHADYQEVLCHNKKYEYETSSFVQDWFPNDKDHVALRSTVGKAPLTYARLHDHLVSMREFLQHKFVCGGRRASVKPRVAVMCLDTEPDVLAVAVLSIMNAGATACPLDSTLSALDFHKAVKQLDCTWILHSEQVQLKYDAAQAIVISPMFDTTGLFTVLDESKELKMDSNPINETLPSDGPMIILRTSGTTAEPKLVPLSGQNLFHNAHFLANSLKLQRQDIALNVMPYFHIGGLSCTLLAVLVSGSQVICAPTFNVMTFIDMLTNPQVSPTWYYAVPTIHKALLIYLTSLRVKQPDVLKQIKLRLVRSGAAHLHHEDAAQLSELLRCPVLPTYSMSECMPIASPPVDYKLHKRDSCGRPVGPSIRIVNPENGEPLPYGQVGEIVLKGVGVISGYLPAAGVEQEEKEFNKHTFTQDGWLFTGDRGVIDQDGYLFHKGRAKDVVKRGGEQISLLEVDEILMGCENVRTLISFAVPNAFWGEEVQAVVVFNNDLSDRKLNPQEQLDILARYCMSHLAQYKRPAAYYPLESIAEIPKSASGKYLRRKLADFVNARAVDNQAMQGMLLATGQMDGAIGIQVETEIRVDHPATSDISDEIATELTIQKTPSQALIGIRFLLALHVTEVHIGVFPTQQWAQWQGFSMNMAGFFFLAAFLLTCSIDKEIKIEERRSFWAHRIGVAHPMFILAMLYSLPAYLVVLFHKGNEDQEDSESSLSLIWLPLQMFGIFTGLPALNPIPLSWFQGVYYQFLLCAPCMDSMIRKLYVVRPREKIYERIRNRAYLWICGSSVWWIVLLMTGMIWGFSYQIVGWLPLLFASMLLAHQWRLQRTPDRNSRAWGVLADVLSLMLLLLVVIMFLFPDKVDYTFQEWKNGERGELSDEGIEGEDAVELPWRYPNTPGGILGFGHVGDPLLLMWLYVLAMDTGKSVTGMIFSSKVFVALAPFAYGLYLFHHATAFYWYFAVHGMKWQSWWLGASAIPFQVEAWEWLCIVMITLCISWFAQTYCVGPMIPTSIRCWVKCFDCSCDGGVDKCYCALCKKCCDCAHCVEHHCPKPDANASLQVIEMKNMPSETTFAIIRQVLRNMSGANVTLDSELSSLGLDSFGTVALVGMLKSSDLTSQQTDRLSVGSLKNISNVRQLVALLNAVDTVEEIQAPTDPVPSNVRIHI